ncbi:hypothetical protein DHW03_00505 [Pedobacter yonginense]|uniref:Uncharacterized protein n=1 Tax=Pedobacter yonginense TaxID=651869 RepID=A0A317ERA9_9SPHI|nr:hypothetical protein [Pedobacter yonginense]PWS28373.1 hypothetical protein DHW03_00505 [Pedobacter yonginense]
MKFRITPLNIITSIAFAFLAVSIFQTKPAGKPFDMGAFYKLILVCLIVVTFITDLIFRFSFKNLKRIWVVELVFILIAAILMLILQKVA